MQINIKNLNEVGQYAVTLIVERTAKGIDATGNPFLPYSTNPFAMPASATTKAALQRLKAQGLLNYFTTKKGTLWVIVKGGYRALKQARYPQDSGTVNLWATGAMMRNLRVLRTDGDAVIIGFSRQEEMKKAFWNQNAKANRKFMGLVKNEIAELTKRVAVEIKFDI